MAILNCLNQNGSLTLVSANGALNYWPQGCYSKGGERYPLDSDQFSAFVESGKEWRDFYSGQRNEYYIHHTPLIC